MTLIERATASDRMESAGSTEVGRSGGGAGYDKRGSPTMIGLYDAACGRPPSRGPNLIGAPVTRLVSDDPRG